MCAKCCGFGMQIFDANKFASDNITCDAVGCSRDGEPFKKNEQFVCCSLRHQWDICLDCHKSYY